jgi:carbamoyl-phosphate synthase small subunit
MTYPLIGNYGITANDYESKTVQAAGFIIKKLCSKPSNWRSEGSLTNYLIDKGVVGIQGIDTRSITRKIRSAGVMMGAISSECDPDQLLQRIRTAPAYDSVNYVHAVSTKEPYCWKSATEGAETRYRIAVLDCGLKYNILRSLAKRGADATVYPAATDAPAILRSYRILSTRFALLRMPSRPWASAWAISFSDMHSAAKPISCRSGTEDATIPLKTFTAIAS